MKVFVAGKYREEVEGTREEFVKACTELGESLARAKFTIVVGQFAHEEGADLHVIRGANQVDRKTTVIVCVDENIPENPYSKYSNELPNINFTHKRMRGGSMVQKVFEVREADVLILVGGMDRARILGNIAPALETPVIAFRHFGGAAQLVWDNYHEDYPRCGLTDDEIRLIQGAWTNNSAENITRIVRTIFKNNPYRVGNVGVQLAALFTSASLVTVYLWYMSRRKRMSTQTTRAAPGTR